MRKYSKSKFMYFQTIVAINVWQNIKKCHKIYNPPSPNSMLMFRNFVTWYLPNTTQIQGEETIISFFFIERSLCYNFWQRLPKNQGKKMKRSGTIFFSKVCLVQSNDLQSSESAKNMTEQDLRSLFYHLLSSIIFY